MAHRGWKVAGVEFSPKAAAEARALGFPVYTGTVETAPGPDVPVDLVVGWMVLEHLHDPVRGLRKIHKWTRPDGWFAFSVPNCASLDFRIFKDKAYALHLPAHLYHFTPATVRRLLAYAGWRVHSIMHQRSCSNLLASVGYARRDRGLNDRLSRWLINYPVTEHRWAFLWSNPLAWLLAKTGQSGRMTVWARKQS
jgi:SAM-dependent methyltransferase